jgi:hypothetical protein
MPYFYSYAILSELKLILCNFQGESTFDHIRQMNLQFAADPESESMQNLLLDFRHSVSIAYKFELFQYMDFLKHNLKPTSKVKVGILISTPNQKFLVSIYKPMARLLGLNVKVFNELMPCIKWMKIPHGDHKTVEETLSGIEDKTMIYY